LVASYPSDALLRDACCHAGFFGHVRWSCNAAGGSARAFVFVAPASWLLLAIVVLIAALISRSLSSRGTGASCQMSPVSTDLPGCPSGRHRSILPHRNNLACRVGLTFQIWLDRIGSYFSLYIAVRDAEFSPRTRGSCSCRPVHVRPSPR
jgi:hypothetical protein